MSGLRSSFQQFFSSFRRHFQQQSVSERVADAFVVAILALFLGVLSDRTDITLGDQELTMKKFHLLDLMVSTKPSSLPEDILAVNIAFDRQLAPIFDEYGMSMGNIDVTDRKTLTRFLEIIQDTHYQGIALDVLFDDMLVCDGDDELFKTINETRDIVVATHADISPSHKLDSCRLGLSDYSVNILSGGFTRYQFLDQSDRQSIAMKLFSLGNRDVKIPDFTALTSYRSHLLPLDIDLADSYDDNQEKQWYNLGADIIDAMSEQEIKSLVSGKYIMIGDFADKDIHDTYKGYVAGPVIIINAFQALRNSKAEVKPLSAAISFLVYFAITLASVFNISIINILPSRVNAFIKYIISLCGIGTVLFFLQLCLFVSFREFHDMWITALFLSVFAYIFEKRSPCLPHSTAKKH